MSVQTSPASLQAAYEIVEVLEAASKEGLSAETLEEAVREKLPLVGVEELVHQLREAEGVTSGLMRMGSTLSPATYCILSCAHARAERALEVAEGLSSRV